jgi:hypothetical protein
MSSCIYMPPLTYNVVKDGLQRTRRVIQITPMRHAKYPMPDVLYPYLNMQGILDARILRLVLLLELPGKELPVELAWAPE